MGAMRTMRRAATPIQRTGRNSARTERYYPVPRAELLAAVSRAAGRLPRWTVESTGETGLRLARRTRLFRFADDVSVGCSGSQDGAGETVRATFESASRLGRYDLGQNGRNLRELLEAVDGEIRRGP